MIESGALLCKRMIYPHTIGKISMVDKFLFNRWKKLFSMTDSLIQPYLHILVYFTERQRALMSTVRDKSETKMSGKSVNQPVPTLECKCEPALTC